MHNIGNEHDAQTILHWVRDHSSEYGIPLCVEQESAPYQWEFIGYGSFRSVWLSPEGVAYKVDHSSGRWNGQCQEEIDNLKAAWEKGVIDGTRLPKFSEYDFGDEIVVAIELIKGSTLRTYRSTLGSYRGSSDRDYHDLMREVEDYYRLGDLHTENVMVDEEGFLVPIDFGG